MRDEVISDDEGGVEVVKEADINIHYRISYYYWLRVKFGCWKAFASMWGMSLLKAMSQSFFKSIGMSIGVFFIKRLFLDHHNLQEFYK